MPAFPLVKNLLRASLAATLGLAALSSSAQNYPTKPVRVFVGLAAGGGTDLIARIITPKLSDALGQPFVIENRVGAAGMIAAEAAAKATPDGYTLLFSPNGVFTINPTMYKKINYSPTKDFVPIALAVTFPLIVSVNANVPAKSVKELVEFLKKNAGKNNCGGSGATFELAVRLLTSKTGTDCTFIQYKGNNETAQALMTGDLHFGLVDTGPIFPAIQSGKVHGLAVTTPQRDPTFPDMPSVVEAGFPDLEMRFWMGYFAPAGTPPAITKRLESEVMRAVKMPDVVKQLTNRQVSANPMGSEEFGKFIASEIQRWDGVRKAANIPQVD
jgi:tripartite-type tricarboxylate transporter receptor subunit TctC